MAIRVNINGKMIDPQEATISVFDHGFLFGDSVYEVVRTYQGIPFYLEEHFSRLKTSASYLALQLGVSLQDLKERIALSLENLSHGESYIRIIVTRGAGEVNLDPASCEKPCQVIIVQPLSVYPEEYYTRGIKIHIPQILRNSSRSLNPQIKSGNYLNNLLALVEAKKAGAQEAVMLNVQGQVTEGTTSNVFIVKKGKVLTPSKESGILEGITRKILLDLARENRIPLETTFLSQGDLEGAEEIFITSTTRQVVPVHWLGEKEISSPGPVTLSLMGIFEKHVQEYLKKIKQ